MTTSTLNYDAYDVLLQQASVARTLTSGDDLTEHDTGQWAAGTYHLGDGRTLLVHLGGTATLTDDRPEAAEDPLAGTRCTECNGLPRIATGLPAFVTFTAEGVATVGVDTAELGATPAHEVDWDHTEDCPGMSEEDAYTVAAAVRPLGARVALLAAPSVDVTL